MSEKMTKVNQQKNVRENDQECNVKSKTEDSVHEKIKPISNPKGFGTQTQIQKNFSKNQNTVHEK